MLSTPSQDLLSPRDYQWLYLDLNSYFASVEQQINPALRGKPVAVIPLESDATCAIAASREAKAHGIKTGTKVYDAKRLCPETIFVLADHERYVHYHHRVMQELERHLPVESIESIDEAACRLTADQCNRDTAIAIAERIKVGLAKHVGEHITCSIGIAPNQYLAKIATELQKPNGLVVLEAATMQERVCSLELGQLTGIGYGMQQRLQRAGIHTVAQLWQLPRQQMRLIWGGIGGERFWYGLHGIHLPKLETTRSSIGHSHMLAPEWRPYALAYTVAQRLLLKAASRLRRMEYVAQSMQLGIRCESGHRFEANLHFRQACDSMALKHSMQTGWDEVIAQARKAGASMRIKKISITLNQLTAQSDVQPELFDEPEHRMSMQRHLALSNAMDSLNARYGRDTVVTGFLPKRAQSFSGTKIAFSRIPDRQEFHE